MIILTSKQCRLLVTVGLPNGYYVLLWSTFTDDRVAKSNQHSVKISRLVHIIQDVTDFLKTLSWTIYCRREEKGPLNKENCEKFINIKYFLRPPVNLFDFHGRNFNWYCFELIHYATIYCFSGNNGHFSNSEGCILVMFVHLSLIRESATFPIWPWRLSRWQTVAH